MTEEERWYENQKKQAADVAISYYLTHMREGVKNNVTKTTTEPETEQ